MYVPLLQLQRKTKRQPKRHTKGATEPRLITRQDFSSTETSRLSTTGRSNAWSDSYFLRTRQVVQRYGDARVKYALFMRRPVLCAISLGARVAGTRSAEQRGRNPPHPKTLLPRSRLGRRRRKLVLHRRLLRLSRAARNAATTKNQASARSPPTTPSSSACTLAACRLPRHGGAPLRRNRNGRDGRIRRFRRLSQSRCQEKGARGFVGCASARNRAFLLARKRGAGTMPHGLIGYAGSTLRAARDVCRNVSSRQARRVGRLLRTRGHRLAWHYARASQSEPPKERSAVRLDTHGGRFVEGLDTASSYALLGETRSAFVARLSQRGGVEVFDRNGSVGSGGVASCASSWIKAGFERVGLVASSSFTIEKCAAFALADAPVETIGTGSYLPERWSETQATADIVSYDGVERVKLGREFLLPSKKL